MNQLEPEKKYDALLWDMDGVLIDVSRSYNEAIRRTAQMFSGKQDLEMAEVTAIKRIPGLNNDWDATMALVQKLNDSQFVAQEFLSDLPLIRQSAKYKKIKNVFQSLYLGKDLYYEFYGEKPPLSSDEGLISQETAFLGRSDLKDLLETYGKMAIVTSRPRFEAEHTLLINQIRDLFEVIVCQEDAEYEKPHPEPVLKAINQLGCQNPLFLGDTINDVLAAKSASISCIYINSEPLVKKQVATTMEAFNHLNFRDEEVESAKQITTNEVSSSYFGLPHETYYLQKNNSPTRLLEAEESIDDLSNNQDDALILAKLGGRQSQHERNTNETKIYLNLNLDGTGQRQISTKIGFLDHMLDLFAKHGNFDLDLRCDGDMHIDDHHSIEDIGIALGQAFAQAIGDKKGINRYGFFMLPMDECLTTVAFDFSGRYSFQLSVDFNRERVGDFSTELVYDFWDAFAQNSKSSLIIKSEFGRNDHHKVEGIFKAAAKAIRIACAKDPHNPDSIPSTKGTLSI